MAKIFLNVKPRAEALTRLLSRAEIARRKVTVPVEDALGMVTSSPVFAKISMPGYHAAAMDGIAVRAEKTFGTSDQTPLLLNPGSDYLPVNTGNPLPEGFDAVIKIEDIQPRPDQGVEIMAPATPWQHIRPVGEDVVEGDLIVTGYHRLRPPDLGALLAGGINELPVLDAPRVIIIPTGSEIVPPGCRLTKGQITDFNSTAIAAYLKEWGARPVTWPIVPDDRDQIKQSVIKATREGDLVIIIAGSSAGQKDYTVLAIQELGEVFLHGVATRPGKPTVLGKINNTPVVGLPGYPVSAYLSLEWFVRPIIYRYFGQPEPERERLPVTLGRRIISEIGVEEHVRLAVGFVNGHFIANPLPRGAGVTMSLVQADGLLVIPAECAGYEQGQTVQIELYRPPAELRSNLLAAGSHDLIINLLANALKQRDPNLNLTSSHLGSMGGILAINNDQAHIAGVHLFDPDSGEYNLPYIRRLLPGKPVLLVNLAYRQQGWIVPPGNPDQVKTVADLANNRLDFVNRQKGAGTRLLFDYLLSKHELAATQISGYQREEHTHLNVAAAVAAGTARAGLGILSAARSFGLDFVPVAEERYDLLMTEDFYRSPTGKLLLETITAPSFQADVDKLGDYSMREAGKIFRP
ncbi:MAG TPA: molybdopterin biosynthesis protein [Firmicutes bacterium]|nr:molybdopterin biosynthesis protein [Bacillota bacterium]